MNVLFLRLLSLVPRGPFFIAALRRAAFALLACLVLLGCRSASKGPAIGILANLTPTRVVGVTHAERLNDGLVPAEGSGWNLSRSAVFEGQHAFVEYDLGSDKPIKAAALLGDNNDGYALLGSSDGRSFEPLWLASRTSGSGLRYRGESALAGSARYLRLQPKGGDRGLSVAEITVFSEVPTSLPPAGLKEVRSLDPALDMRHALLHFFTAALIAIVLSAAPASLFYNGALALLLLVGLGQLILTFRESFPLAELEVSLARAISATVALAVVLRETYAPKSFPAYRPISIGALAVCAVIAVGAFFNLGRPQFFDAKLGEPSVVHNFDMRVYFPVAKYFDELKYDGLYLASTLSYAEEHGGLENPQIARTELRDLRDHRMRRASEVDAEIREIRGRFSDARWAEFKGDMAYFWETMGPGGYLGSMRDHGGNATPVWMSIAYLMFKDVAASNEVLLWAGALDPLLLLVFAFCAYRSFGIQTALVSLVIFGANDFYMFGSNWAGATLRNDWMVYLGLGACALKTERYRLGGALLAFSALIRAFPAISLLALGVPVLYAALGQFTATRKWPTPKELYASQRWFFQTALGATGFVLVAVLASSLIMGWDAWPLWVKKISSFTASPHVNHLSLLTVTSGSEGNQLLVNQARLPLHVTLSVVYVVLSLWASYRRPPHVAALLGMVLMPVFMYPANYYIHFIFLLALLVDEPGLTAGRWVKEASGKVWLLLLGLCAAQYFTVKEQSLDLHFYNASVLLMAALLLVLVVLLPRDDEGHVVVPEFVSVLWARRQGFFEAKRVPEKTRAQPGQRKGKEARAKDATRPSPDAPPEG